MSGKFIVFEGPDGSGKTTQIKMLGEKIVQRGHQVVYTREPGGTRISEKIRNILLDPQNKELDSKTEALLYAAARAQHVEELIKPNLAENKIVISDRFVDSTLAYQGFGRQLDLAYLKDVNRMATGEVSPDLVIIIDVPPEVGLKRITETRNAGGQGVTDRIELEDMTFHQRVRDGFIALAQSNKEKYLIINGEDDLNIISQNIYSQVRDKLKI